MKDIFQLRIRLEITCADNVILLNALNAANIKLEDVYYQTDLTLHITIYKNDYIAAQSICKKRGASIRIIKKLGVLPALENVLKRPVLIAFTCITIFLFCYIPSRVLWQIKVYFEHRCDETELRTFFPKGNTSKCYAIPNELASISEDNIACVCESNLPKLTVPSISICFEIIFIPFSVNFNSEVSSSLVTIQLKSLAV